MSTRNNVVSGERPRRKTEQRPRAFVTVDKKFIDIRAIDSGRHKSICCSFCKACFVYEDSYTQRAGYACNCRVGEAIATHLVYRLHRDDSFSLNYGCDSCATGWRESK